MSNTDPLDAAFGEPEKLEGENRAKLAQLVVPFVTINPESGTVHYKSEADKLNSRQRILVFLLSRLALSTRNPAFPSALSPKEIEQEASIPGGTLRPKLGELVRERVVIQDKDGKYSVPPSVINRAKLMLEDVLPQGQE